MNIYLLVNKDISREVTMDTNAIMQIVYAISIVTGFITMLLSWASSEGEHITDKQRTFYGRTFLAGAGLICITIAYIEHTALIIIAIASIASFAGLVYFIANYLTDNDAKERYQRDSAMATKCRAAIEKINQTSATG